MRSATVLLSLIVWGCSPQGETSPQELQPRNPAAEPAPATGPLTVLVHDPAGEELPMSTFLRWLAREQGEDSEVGLLTGHLVTLAPGQQDFEFEVPAGLPVEVLVCAGDRRVRGRSEAPADGTARLLQLDLPAPNQRVEGRLVRTDGAAIGGVRLRIGPHATLARPDGTFEVTLPVEGRSLYFEVEGYAPVRIPWSGEGAPLEVVLEPGARLELEVRWPDGRPAWVVAHLAGEGAGYTRHASGDELGRVGFEGLPPGEPLYLRVYGAVRPPAPPTPIRERDLIFVAAEPFELASDVSRVETLVLPPSGLIAGRLLDQAGQPLAGVELCLAAPHVGQAPGATYLDHAHQVRARVVSDGDGAFRFVDAPGGSWLVGVARGPWNTKSPTGRRVSPAALLVRTGEQDLELTVAVGLTLTGRVVNGGKVLARTRVEARPRAFGGAREAFTSRDGTFELERLMPGPHDLYLGGELILGGVDPATPSVELTLKRSQ